MADTLPSRMSRIPIALQSVFLASNRGNEVHVPPPENVASKVYGENWSLQQSPEPSTSRSSSSNTNQLHTTQKYATVERSTTKNMIVVEEETCSQDDATENIPLQKYLDNELQARGYLTRTYEPLYHQKPTPLQRASYDVYLISLVRNNDLETFRKVISSGISPNPCNRYGESLLHTVCRRGDYPFLQALIDAGASVQVADDYGRTPLHDACWSPTPTFETIHMLLQLDPLLLYMGDSRGHMPLHYVRKQHWGAWKAFLAAHWDVYWPRHDCHNDDDDCRNRRRLPTPQFSLPDPDNALTLELAAAVADGRLEPEEAQFLNPSSEDYYGSYDDSYEFSDYDDSSYEDIDDGGSSCESLEEDLMGSLAFGRLDDEDETWETHISFIGSLVLDDDDDDDDSESDTDESYDEDDDE